VKVAAKAPVVEAEEETEDDVDDVTLPG